MVIFFKALCARNGTNNLFERDFVLETGDVALRHGKYDRQDFEKVVSATGCEPLEGLLVAPTTTSSRTSTRRRSTGTRSSRTSSSSASILPRRRRATDIRHRQLARVRLTTAELLKNYSSTARTSRRSRSAGKTSSSPRLRRGSIGSRRSLPGASSARSSTSSSTRSSRFWSRTEAAWRATEGQTLSIRVLRTSFSPTRISSAGTATATRSRFSTT